MRWFHLLRLRRSLVFKVSGPKSHILPNTKVGVAADDGKNWIKTTTVLPSFSYPSVLIIQDTKL